MSICSIIKYLDTRIVRKVGIIRARKLARFLTGFLPVFGALWFIINVLMQITVGESFLFGLVFKHAFIWMCFITILSIAYEFCWVHRAFVLYDYIVSISIEHQIEVGFDEWLYPLRILKIVAGLFLFFVFIHNSCWHDFVEKQRKFR